MKATVAQSGNLVINASMDYQPVKLMEEGSKMVHFSSRKDNACRIIQSLSSRKLRGLTNSELKNKKR